MSDSLFIQYENIENTNRQEGYKSTNANAAFYKELVANVAIVA